MAQAEMAAKMMQAKKEQDAQVQEKINLVNDGSLTREEAAKCLTGAAQKIAAEHNLPGCAGIEYYQLLIDQGIDSENFQGLRIGRHF